MSGRVVVIATVFLLTAVLNTVAAVSASKKRNGFNFLNGQWSVPKYDSATAAASLHTMQQQTGADWVALTYCHFLSSINSTGPIYTRASSPTSDQLRAFVKNVTYKSSIRVLFRPCVDPDWRYVGSLGWRGEFGMFFTTAAEWDAWFATYETFIVDQARLARELQPYGVEMFAIGMEYTASSFQAQHWRRIAKAVKKVLHQDIYSLPAEGTAGSGGGDDSFTPTLLPRMNVTYCANFGAEVGITWWDAVDEISVDAYYPLAWDVARPTLGQLTAAWQPIIAELANISASHGDKPVNFAEIGYCSATGTNTFPSHCGGDPLFAPSNPVEVNLTIQTVLYEAFFATVYQQPWFRGVFWWDWLTRPDDGGHNNSGFSVRDKPVGALIRKHFDY